MNRTPHVISVSAASVLAFAALSYGAPDMPPAAAVPATPPPAVVPAPPSVTVPTTPPAKDPNVAPKGDNDGDRDDRTKPNVTPRTPNATDRVRDRDDHDKDDHDRDHVRDHRRDDHDRDDRSSRTNGVSNGGVIPDNR